MKDKLRGCQLGRGAPEDGGASRRLELMVPPLERIVSGGQTGADRAALDVAIRHGVPHGGWCPKGRMAEDGRLDQKYDLVETPSDSYMQRTEWNVRDSDGTAVFTLESEVTGGSLYTIEVAARRGKPCLHLCRGRDADPAGLLDAFVRDNGIKTLNVAGSRESKEPGLHEWVVGVLDEVFSRAGRRPRSPDQEEKPRLFRGGARGLRA